MTNTIIPDVNVKFYSGLPWKNVEFNKKKRIFAGKLDF